MAPAPATQTRFIGLVVICHSWRNNARRKEIDSVEKIAATSRLRDSCACLEIVALPQT
jgi:hypothetical protein